MEKTLIEMLIDAGYPKEDIFHHYSDLYVFATPMTERVIKEWMNINGYNKEMLKSKLLFDTFTDQVTGKKMYDIGFQYYEMEDIKNG